MLTTYLKIDTDLEQQPNIDVEQSLFPDPANENTYAEQSTQENNGKTLIKLLSKIC